MDRSVTDEMGGTRLVCAQCAACYQGRQLVLPLACPLCAGVLQVTGNAPPVSTISHRADARNFHRVLLQLVARSSRTGLGIADVKLPANIRPIHIRMRRFRGEFESLSAASNVHAVTSRYQFDVCLAVGLPETLVSALESAGFARSTRQGVPRGELCLLACDDATANQRASDRFQDLMVGAQRVCDEDIVRVDPIRGEDFYYPIWLCVLPIRGRILHLAVDAETNRILQESWEDAPSVAAGRRRVLRWILALLALVVAAVAVGFSGGSLVSSRDLPVVLMLFALTLGWFYLIRSSAHAQLRRSALDGDLLSIDYIVQRLRRARRIALVALFCLVGTLLLVGASRMKTAWFYEDPIPFVSLSERGVDAETLRPWSSINTNFLQSPFGVNGHQYVVTKAVPRIGPQLQPGIPVHLSPSGIIRIVGPGGYGALADAIDASGAGDTIHVHTGRHPGGRSVIRHDLLIEGDPGATIEWQGGKGPYIEIGAADTTVAIRHLRLEGDRVNSNLLGDPNIAYGAPEQGVRPHLILEDVAIVNSGGGAVSFQSAGATMEVYGGYLSSLVASNASRVVVTAGRQPTGSVHSVLFPGHYGPGIARSVCVICLFDADDVFLDHVGSVVGRGEILVGSSAGRVRLGEHLGNVTIRLMDDSGRDQGNLPLPKAAPFAFRVVHGVAEF